MDPAVEAKRPNPGSWPRGPPKEKPTIPVNRPFFAGNPVARIPGHGKEEFWKGTSRRAACACRAHGPGSRVRPSAPFCSDFIDETEAWMKPRQSAHPARTGGRSIRMAGKGNTRHGGQGMRGPRKYSRYRSSRGAFGPSAARSGSRRLPAAAAAILLACSSESCSG